MDKQQGELRDRLGIFLVCLCALAIAPAPLHPATALQLEEQAQMEKEAAVQCAMLQAKVDELQRGITAAREEGEARVAQTVAEAQAQQQVGAANSL